MSEPHIEEHSTWIKMPKQLVTEQKDFGPGHPGMTDEAVAERLKPVGEVVVSDPNAPKVEKSGKEIYGAVCTACHSTGVLNAPKVGDKAAWGKLIQQGLAQLTQDAIKGIRQMPRRQSGPL